MRSHRLRAVFVAGACVAALATRPCAASERGYDVWFAGRVLSVDSHRGRLRIARGPIETAGRAVEECIVAGGDLTRLRPGMRIEAQADTRRRPWRVLHLRVLERKTIAPPGGTPAVALLAKGSFRA